MPRAVVECYAGHRYPEQPRAFLWQDEWVEVEEIVRQWRTPDGLSFRVRTAAARTFTLTYDQATDAWTITPTKNE